MRPDTTHDNQPNLWRGLEHITLANGIEQFSFLQPSRAAVDDYHTYIETLFQRSQNSDSLMLLIDISKSKSPPLQYFAQKARELVARYPARPNTKTAIVARFDPLLNVTDTLTRLMRFDRQVHPVRFFRDTERAEAETWLLSSNNDSNSPASPTRRTL